MATQGEVGKTAAGLKKESIYPVRKKDFCFAFFLSLIFTLGIFAAAFVLILIVFQLLMAALIPSPWNYYGDDQAVEAAEAWIETLKIVALIVLILLILLIIAGFLIKKFKLSFVSSLAAILPVFSYLSASMTWLSGLSALMMLWLPISETCPEILGLGDIVFAPFLIPILDSRNSYDPRWNPEVFLQMYSWLSLLLFLIMAGGVFLFVFSVTTWLYGKSKRYELITFWIYKYSRHPQYLGFLLLSYGLVIFFGFRPGWPEVDYYIPAPTLFWLISALSIIGIALREENQLMAQSSQEYVNWRTRTPFMVPLPKQLSSLILIPIKVFLKKNWPENDKEIVFVLSIYGLLLILLSLPIIGLYYPTA